MKPKLLVVELWGLGDLVIGTPFLRQATETYDVTLLAKPYAQELQPRFWPNVRVIPFTVPWTAFKHKYQLWRWHWLGMERLRRRLHRERFEFGLSARWDPRDHFLLMSIGARTRLGFPRLHSERLLDRPLTRPPTSSHRYENWRVLGLELGFELPPLEHLALPQVRNQGEVLVHTGAGQPIRVWPLERYQHLVAHLRQLGYRVRVACDPDQEAWWRKTGETPLEVPHTVGELLHLIDQAAAFVGNDSGPGHLAAFSGVPTFTIFGPQLPEWFAPLHPASEWLEGKACPYKPCSDYCRFSSPGCMVNWTGEEVRTQVCAFLKRVLVPAPATP